MEVAMGELSRNGSGYKKDIFCRFVKIQDDIFENIPDTRKNRGNASCDCQVLSCVFLQK